MFQTPSESVHDGIMGSIQLPHSQNIPESNFYDLSWPNQTPFQLMDTGNLVAESVPKQSANLQNEFQSQMAPAQGQLFSPTTNGKICEVVQPRSSIQTSAEVSRVIELDSKSSCIQKLSQLNTELFEHSSTVPPLDIYTTSTNLEDYLIYRSKYSLEDTFRLTQSLIDMYPIFLNAFLPPPLAQSSSTNGSWLIASSDFENSQISLSPSRSTADARKSRLDHSSILLIISCHLRLISIYEALCNHMRMCFKEGGIITMPRQAIIEAPPLKIGNYCPPPSAAVGMQMLLLVQFGLQLYNYAAELASEIERCGKESTTNDSPHVRNESDDTLVLTRGAAEHVKSAALKMAQDLGAMRDQALQARFSNN